MRLIYIPKTIVTPSYEPVNYGYLYNWYTVDDVRNIANTGWHVPVYSDLSTLSTYLGGNTVSGGKLKEIGFTWWNSPNTGATNEVNFNARGAGYRHGSTGIFDLLKTHLFLANTTFTQYIEIRSISDDFGVNGLQGETTGTCIRLIKNTTTLSHGETGTYTGNDGKVYRTICIGTQEWVADNLKETKYRDGSLIPVVTDNTAWAALTTGARCVYDNLESNA